MYEPCFPRAWNSVGSYGRFLHLTKLPKLTEENILYIRKCLKEGKRGTQRQLAKEFGVSETLICRIKTGPNWDYIQLSPDN